MCVCMCVSCDSIKNLFCYLIFSILPAPTQRLFDRDDEDKAYRAQMQVSEKDSCEVLVINLNSCLCCIVVAIRIVMPVILR